MIASCSYHATMGLGFYSILVKQQNTYSKTTAQRGFLINTEVLNPDVADLPYPNVQPLRIFPHSSMLGFLNVSALAGMLCLPRWSCLSLVSQLVSHLPYDAVSASLVLSSCHLACLPSALGFCVRFPGLVFLFSPTGPAFLACLLAYKSPVLSPILSSNLPCPCPGLVSQISCAICATVWGLRWCSFLTGFGDCKRAWVNDDVYGTCPQCSVEWIANQEPWMLMVEDCKLGHTQSSPSWDRARVRTGAR